MRIYTKMWMPLIISLLYIFSGSPAFAQDSETESLKDPSQVEQENTATEETEDMSSDDTEDEGDWGTTDATVPGSDPFAPAGGSFGDIQIDLGELAPVVQSPFSFNGFVREDLAYSYLKPDDSFDFIREDAELSKMRTTLFLSMNYKLNADWKAQVSGNFFYDDYYRQKDRDLFPEATLETYETEAEFRDTFIEGQIVSGFGLKLGRQIIAWGQSEGSQVVDMANPRDNRELGQTTLEDMRIPVLASRIYWVQDGWQIDAVAIHEFRPNKAGSEGSDFDQYILLRQAGLQLNDAGEPENSAENTEGLARIHKTFNGGDASLIYADVYDDEPYLEYDAIHSRPLLRQLLVTPKFNRIKTLGASGNIVTGSWLLKTEIAQKTGVMYMRNDIQAQLMSGNFFPESVVEKDILQGVMGADYTGINDLTVSLEFVGRQILEFEDIIMSDETTLTWSFSLMHDAVNDTVHSRFFWLHLTGDNGDVYRFTVDYDMLDALQLSGGVVVYDATVEDAFAYPFRNNDRLIAGVKYSF
ncbi:MAG: hypothetical protein HQM12_05680 [SAR324 cluster bacterium]|nr:hypothetical protein [SAR324 cluster bacterium]